MDRGKRREEREEEEEMASFQSSSSTNQKDCIQDPTTIFTIKAVKVKKRHEEEKR